MADGEKLAALEKAFLNQSVDPVDLPFSLLMSITENFSDAREIGRGGFGAVYKGVLPSGGTVAVKQLFERYEILDKNFESEVTCLAGVKHKNTVRFLGYCSETQQVLMPYDGKRVLADVRHRLLCFEYMPKGCLADYLSEPVLPGGSPADEDAEAEVASNELRDLPVQALQARLQRMQAIIHGGIADRLPDGGKTYRRKLLAVRRELERRNGQAPALAATAPPTPSPSPSSQPPPPRQGGSPADDQCKRSVQSRCMESSDVQRTSYLSDQVKDEQMETPVCSSKQLPDAHPIKPKVEPCEDSLSPALDASEDCQTTPLSCNHPFFTIILSRSHVQKPFQLCIPGRFHRHLPEARTSTTLICHGRSWAMRYCGDLKKKKLDADWMDFAVDNRLQINDACVFQLVSGTREEVVFQVQILWGGLPKEITSKGYTADEPLVIVD